MRTVFKRSYTVVYAVIACMLIVSCQQEELTAPSSSDITTITAFTGSDTKIGFIDQGSNGVKLAWSAGDSFTLYDASGNYAGTFSLQNGTEGSTAGTFTSSDVFTSGVTYTAVYPAAANQSDSFEEYVHYMNSSTQNGNSSTEHLDGLCFMQAAYTHTGATGGTLSFGHQYALLTVKLGTPEGYSAQTKGTPTQLIVRNGSEAYRLKLSNVDWSNTLTAYLMVKPCNATERTLSFEVSTSKNAVFYKASRSTNKAYLAGKRYTADFTSVLPTDMSWTVVGGVRATNTTLASSSLANIIDGDVNTQWEASWESGVSPNGYPRIVTIDMKESKTVSSFDLIRSPATPGFNWNAWASEETVFFNWILSDEIPTERATEGTIWDNTAAFPQRSISSKAAGGETTADGTVLAGSLWFNTDGDLRNWQNFAIGSGKAGRYLSIIVRASGYYTEGEVWSQPQRSRFAEVRINIDGDSFEDPGSGGGGSSSATAPDPLVPSSFSAWGTANIVEQYNVGPGTTYANVQYSGTKAQNIYIMRVDMQNSYANVEGYSQKIPASSYAAVKAQCAANSDLSGHRVVGGVNQDFFISTDGSDAIRIPYGPDIINGRFYAPPWGCYGMLAINDNKSASVFGISTLYQTYVNYAIFPSGQSIGIASYNTTAALWCDQECLLYTDMNSLSTLPTYSGNVFVRIDNSGDWYVNGADKSCQVLEISQSALTPNSSSFILAFNDKSWSNPGAATYAKNTLKVGDYIKIRQNLNVTLGTAPTNIVTGFHGTPCLVYNGAVATSQISAASGTTGTSNRARTMMGISQDKRYLYVVVVDGPEKTTYTGTYPTEGAQYMLHIGCYDAVNFDGGGSSEMVLGSRSTNSFTTKNTPSDGSSRAVINTAQVISTAPHSVSVAGYGFKKPLITSAQTLGLVSYNPYNEVLSTSVDASNFTFSCEPSSLGSVNASGYFTPGTTTSGTITATHKTNGYSTKTTVQIP